MISRRFRHRNAVLASLIALALLVSHGQFSLHDHDTLDAGHCAICQVEAELKSAVPAKVWITDAKTLGKFAINQVARSQLVLVFSYFQSRAPPLSSQT